MKERFNQIFGHVAFLPAVIGIWVLATYFETRETWMVFGAVVLLAYCLVIAVYYTPLTMQTILRV